MLSRRSLLAGLGGVTVVGIAGGTLFATTRTPHAALAPWQAPGALADDPRIKAIEWAVLAPNAHNRQPWLIELMGENDAVLRLDIDRRLPQTDPFDRQTLIGLGAFAELLVLAAAEAGHTVTVTAFPEGAPDPSGQLDTRPIAHFAFGPGGTADPLFAAAPLRRSYKEPFETDRPVSVATMAAIKDRAGRPMESTVAAEEVGALKRLCAKAWAIESTTPRTHQESVDLMRIGKAEINANPDGIDRDTRRRMLDGIARLNEEQFDTFGDPETAARIAQYE
ncbi:MAG: hypothetical protein AAFW98_10380, partial [Pseudomonadota bacterium]